AFSEELRSAAEFWECISGYNAPPMSDSTLAKVLWINLDRRTDRAANHEGSLEDAGLEDFGERFSAVEGRDVDFDTVPLSILTAEGRRQASDPPTFVLGRVLPGPLGFGSAGTKFSAASLKRRRPMSATWLSKMTRSMPKELAQLCSGFWKHWTRTIPCGTPALWASSARNLDLKSFTGASPAPPMPRRSRKF
ncbi:unnamed protein product, partial [Effrenium voratum]